MDTLIAFGFPFVNFAIMPLWFGLLVFPRAKWPVVGIDCFVAIAATLYVIILIPGLSVAFPIILKPTIESVGALLSTPYGTFGGWTHFVIGDLWIGRWITHDSHRQAISHFIVVPILVLTLLFGPMGLLTYFIVKLVLRKRFGTAT